MSTTTQTRQSTETAPNLLVCSLLGAIKRSDWQTANRLADELRPVFEIAEADQIDAARQLYATDEIQIDYDARWSDCGDGSGWVQAWVFVHSDDI